MLVPTFQSVAEAFRYCADMDAPLVERLNVFSQATRYLLPGYQEAADRIAARLDDYGACRSAPSSGDPMPAYPYLAPSGMEKLRATHDNRVPLRVGGKLVAAKTRGTC
jgi:hypothetical protein